MILVFTSARLFDGTPVELRVQDGRITAIGAHVDREGAEVIGLAGQTVVPAFLDAHVHLALFPKEEELLAAGVAGAIDWGAPLSTLKRPDGGLVRKDAGPLLTASGGYPTRGWGRDGYGLVVSDPTSAVRTVVEHGAAFVKVAMAGDPGLSDAQLRGIVATAHELGRKVGAHALTDAEAARARRLGVDILVHTPVERLQPATVQAWKDGTVISTLTAFGARPDALANLRDLHGAGADVLYGTDLGNSRDPSIQCAELQAMQATGMAPAEILAAGTTRPAATMGIQHGLQVGSAASFLVLTDATLESLCKPRQVWLRGVRRPLLPRGTRRP